MPAEAHASLIVLAAEFQAMQTLIASIEKRIIAHHRLDEASKRLRSIPGIGLVGATAIAATVTDPRAFRSGRDLAAWIGLVPNKEARESPAPASSEPIPVGSLRGPASPSVVERGQGKHRMSAEVAGAAAFPPRPGASKVPRQDFF
jgi:hypothetical protein